MGRETTPCSRFGPNPTLDPSPDVSVSHEAISGLAPSSRRLVPPHDRAPIHRLPGGLSYPEPALRAFLPAAGSEGALSNAFNAGKGA